MSFAVVRSISDTAIKNGQNVLNALFKITELEATDWLQLDLQKTKKADSIEVDF
jgi:hypothetical protein